MTSTPTLDRLRAADRKRTAVYVRVLGLGVTAAGLEALAAMVRHGRRMSPVPIAAARRLHRAGLIEPNLRGEKLLWIPTADGVEIVRRARTMGY